MKKVLLILLFIICPMMVFADSSGPSILGYDAVVINKNGAKSDDGENGRVIKYNTKVHVYNEYDKEVSVCILDEIDGDSCDKITISAKDISPLKAEVLPKDLEKVNNEGTTLATTNSKLLIVNKNGIKLRKGPSTVYGTYDKIVPYKTVLSFKYYVQSWGPHGSFSYGWVYVDDGEYKGWVDEDTCFLSDGILAFTDIEIDDDNGNLVKIAKETAIDKAYIGYPKYFIEYNGTLGSVEYENMKVGFKSKLGYILTLKSTNLISNGKTVTAIPKGEKIKILYAQEDDEYSDYPIHSTGPICITEKDCYYYVEYNGNKGFVKDDDVKSLYYEQKPESKVADKELEMYDINDNKTGKTIPVNASYTVYASELSSQGKDGKYYNQTLIKYNNEIGFIYLESSEEEYTEPVSEVTPSAKPDNPSNNGKKEDKTLNMIIYCVAGAVLISLTALVTIKLINKKKKSKVEPKNEASKEENIIEPQKKSDQEQKKI